MWLVGRRGKKDLDRPDQLRVDKGSQQDAIALMHSAQDLFEERFSLRF